MEAFLSPHSIVSALYGIDLPWAWQRCFMKPKKVIKKCIKVIHKEELQVRSQLQPVGSCVQTSDRTMVSWTTVSWFCIPNICVSVYRGALSIHGDTEPWNPCRYWKQQMIKSADLGLINLPNTPRAVLWLRLECARRLHVAFPGPQNACFREKHPLLVFLENWKWCFCVLRRHPEA